MTTRLSLARSGVLVLVYGSVSCIAQHGELPSRANYAEVLIDLLGDEQLNDSAREALLGLQPPPAELLAKRVVGAAVEGEEDLRRRRQALVVIGRMGSDASVAFDVLREHWRLCPAPLLVALSYCVAEMAPYAGRSESEVLALIQELSTAHRKRNPRVVTSAFSRDMVVSKGRMSVDPASSTDEELIAIIESETRYAREVAAEELGRRSSRAAIPVLVRALEAGRTSDAFFDRALDALLQLAPEHPANVETYGWRMRTHSDPLARLAAAMQLARFGERAKPALPYLVAALQDENVSVVCAAIEAIGMIGVHAKDAEATLREALRREPAVALRAWGALERIGLLR